MYGLLESNAVTVLNGDGQWMNSYEVDALSCGRVIQGTDICTPVTPSDTGPAAGTGYMVEPFGVEGHQKFGVRCAPDDAKAALTEAMAKASEYVVAKNFWDGAIAGWPGSTTGMFLMDAGIATVASGANVQATISAVLAAAYTAHPDIEPIIHLGILSALNLADNYFTQQSDIDFIVSPGYPPNAVAVTGPMIVRLSTIETLDIVRQSTNRMFISGTRLAAVEFDPCLAVRAT